MKLVQIREFRRVGQSVMSPASLGTYTTSFDMPRFRSKSIRVGITQQRRRYTAAPDIPDIGEAEPEAERKIGGADQGDLVRPLPERRAELPVLQRAVHRRRAGVEIAEIARPCSSGPSRPCRCRPRSARCRWRKRFPSCAVTEYERSPLPFRSSVDTAHRLGPPARVSPHRSPVDRAVDRPAALAGGGPDRSDEVHVRDLAPCSRRGCTGNPACRRCHQAGGGPRRAPPSESGENENRDRSRREERSVATVQHTRWAGSPGRA